MIGIYSIKNVKNNKVYIGSSNNIEKRIKDHFRNLKNNRHSNQYLQNAYNKYGNESFIFEILEVFDKINKYDLLKVESNYLNKVEFKQLYNLTLITNGGGADTLCKKSILIDLRGNVVKECDSLSEIAKFLNIRQITTKIINTPSTVKSIYRVVTKEFYETELELILSWRKYKVFWDDYERYYKYDNHTDKWIVSSNNEIYAITANEELAIKISKLLLKLRIK